MLKEGAVKLQTLHDTQQGATPNVIPLVDATRWQRVRSGTGRVTRTTRGKIGHGVRGKASTSEGEIMVGRDGIEPPTPRSSVLVHSPCKCA